MSSNRNPSAGAKRKKRLDTFKRAAKNTFDAFKTLKLKEELEKKAAKLAATPGRFSIKRHRNSVTSYAGLKRKAKARKRHLAKQPKH